MKAALRWVGPTVITLCIVLFLLRPLSTAAASSRQTQVATSNDQSLEQRVIDAERAGLDALKNGNLEQFAALTADDAIFVPHYRSARHHRYAHRSHRHYAAR